VEINVIIIKLTNFVCFELEIQRMSVSQFSFTLKFILFLFAASIKVSCMYGPFHMRIKERTILKIPYSRILSP